MFEINLNLQILSLHFSEMIGVETFNITLITLQKKANGSTRSHTLTGGGNIDLHLITDDDFNTITSLVDLATQLSNTYISFPQSLVSDVH